MKLPAPREPIIVREASWSTIVLVLITTFGLISAVFLPAIITRLLPLGEGLANLAIFSGIFVVVIGGCALVFGGLRPGDVGLRLGKLTEAMAVVACVWIIIQAAHTVAGLLSHESLQWDDAWLRFGVTDRLLWLAVMLLGTALTEETIFRGFFFPQLYLKCSGSRRTRFWVAAIAAAILFGLFHVPRHIVLSDMNAIGISVRVLAHALGGLLATAMYVRTRNLWLMIGLHGIENAPTRLVASPLPSELLLLLELTLLVTWPWLTRRSQQRGMAAIVGVSAVRTTDHAPTKGAQSAP
jgi:membrane protease YdiL (CAAX protease family)